MVRRYHQMGAECRWRDPGLPTDRGLKLNSRGRRAGRPGWDFASTSSGSYAWQAPPQAPIEQRDRGIMRRMSGGRLKGQFGSSTPDDEMLVFRARASPAVEVSSLEVAGPSAASTASWSCGGRVGTGARHGRSVWTTER